MTVFNCSCPIQAAVWKYDTSVIINNQIASKETTELFYTLTEDSVKVKLL